MLRDMRRYVCSLPTKGLSPPASFTMAIKVIIFLNTTLLVRKQICSTPAAAAAAATQAHESISTFSVHFPFRRVVKGDLYYCPTLCS